MAIYVITGKLGAGKTLCAVGRIRDYLVKGKCVATNLDLRLEHLLPSGNRSARVVRVPDKPSVGDLDSLGLGSDSVDESSFGLLVLDELGSWLNARSWADKDRQAVIDWLIHSRKRRWDILFIVQAASMLDKQVRDALMEFLVQCKRMDRVRLPFIGGLLKALTFGVVTGKLPKVHLAIVVYYGGAATVAGALVSDRWIYRGHDLYAAYDTEQVFSSSYASGLYSYLPPWHVHGRYLPQPRWLLWVAMVRRWWAGGYLARRGVLKPKLALVVLLSRLPVDQRARHFQRFDKLGAF